MIRKQREKQVSILTISRPGSPNNKSNRACSSKKLQQINQQLFNYVEHLQQKIQKKGNDKIKAQYQKYFGTKILAVKQKESAFVLSTILAMIVRKNIKNGFESMKPVSQKEHIPEEQSQIVGIQKMQRKLAIKKIVGTLQAKKRVLMNLFISTIRSSRHSFSNPHKNILSEVSIHSEDQISHPKTSSKNCLEVLLEKQRLIEEIQQLQVLILQKQSRFDQNKASFESAKQKLHDQITQEIQKINISKEDSMAYYRSSMASNEPSVDTCYYELIGRQKSRLKMGESDSVVLEEYVSKSISLEEQIDDLRTVCETNMKQYGGQFSEIQKTLLLEALKVLQIKPLG